MTRERGDVLWNEACKSAPLRKHWRIAERLANKYAGGLLYVISIGWHYWDGQRWARDEGGMVATRCVRETLRAAWGDISLLTEAENEKYPERRKQLIADIGSCETANGTKGVLDLAKTLLCAFVDDMDADPFLVNTATGTLDLRTMVLRGAQSADRITKITTGGYDPDATATEFQTFLGQVLPDPDVRAFMQRLIGSSLLGIVRDHVMPILTGTGQNGKSTFIEAVGNALGDYYMTAAADLLVGAKVHGTETLALRGRRLVTMSETDRGAAMNEVRMKRLTGGDTIEARAHYQAPVTFRPSHTAVMVTNHPPEVSADDPAVWRRLLVVPFDVRIADDKRNVELTEWLRLEANGILSWAIAGYADYDRDGLMPPGAVQARTDAYRDANDAVGLFIEDRCAYEAGNRGLFVPQKDIWEAWQDWSRNQRKPTGRQKDLVASLLSKDGVWQARINAGRFLYGIELSK